MAEHFLKDLLIPDHNLNFPEDCRQQLSQPPAVVLRDEELQLLGQSFKRLYELYVLTTLLPDGLNLLRCGDVAVPVFANLLLQPIEDVLKVYQLRLQSVNQLVCNLDRILGHFQLEVDLGQQLEGFLGQGAALYVLVIALDIVGPRQELQAVVVSLQCHVAPGEGSQDVGVVYFGLLDVAHLRQLGGGDGQVADCLLVAACLEIDLPQREVGGHQSKI